MKFPPNSILFKGVHSVYDRFGHTLPMEYTGARDEILASRQTAWLGSALNVTPVMDISGPDAAKFLNKYCVNRDFSIMEPGSSKHAVMCNERGNMIADGVIIYLESGIYRTYWLAPVIAYYVQNSGMDVKGEWKDDEYFFQIDGPKSLEILEEATQANLHDIKFARNRTVKICGTDMIVHRLGMSGALAYEVHGDKEHAEIVLTRLREVTEKFGGKMLGFRNYIFLNHTPGGYPNQFQHFCYDLYSCDPGLAEFARKHCAPQYGTGSAEEDQEAFYVTPYDIGWGYLVNMNHDFVGKEALVRAKENRSKQMVTLEWNAEDVAEVFASQFRGKDVTPYDPIEAYHSGYHGGLTIPTRGDWVTVNGEKIGIATGRCYAFYEQRMISLASIKKEHAVEGKELIVQWGRKDYPIKEIRAKVAPFPYYNEEFRNETFDTANIPRPNFK
ncbi:MAG: aminomethyl transferase family protein [Saccharofermentanales bacterium]|jgi:glycine cleavage system aminomethyltransferase T